MIAALVTALGIYTIRRFAEWGRRYSIYFVCFAAGVLISVSFLHIKRRYSLCALAAGILVALIIVLSK